MGKFFDSHAIPTYDLLNVSDCFYKIPILQRKYVWDPEKHIKPLLDDMLDGVNSGDDHYFIGGMVFAAGKNGGRQLVIDGQQRLITLMFLISAAKEHFQRDERLDPKDKQHLISMYGHLISRPTLDDNGMPIPAYILELQGADDAVFRKLLNREDASSEGLSVSQKNLVSAKEFIDDYVESVPDLAKYLRFVVQDVYVVRTIAEDQSIAFTLFETMNNRGATLQPEDLIKNLLLKSVDERHYEAFAESWQTFIQQFTDKQSRFVVPVSAFLRHSIMSHGHDVRKDEVFSWYDAHAPTNETQATETLQELTTEGENYRAFLDGKGDPTTKALKALRFRQAYIVMLAALDLPQPDRQKIHRLLESVAFAFVISGSKTNELEDKFVKIAKDARGAEQNPDNVQKVVDALTQIIADIRPIALQKLSTLRYKGRGDKEKVFYFLTKLANALDGGNYSDLTIEHIMSQSAQLSPDEYEKSVQAIGNLTLVTESENSALKDKKFPEKRLIYINCTPRLTSSLAKPIETGMKRSKFDKATAAFGYIPPSGNWDKREIERRTQQMVCLADFVWFNVS